MNLARHHSAVLCWFSFGHDCPALPTQNGFGQLNVVMPTDCKFEGGGLQQTKQCETE